MPVELSTPDILAATILFVDDDADVRHAADMLLSRHGIRLLLATSPQEAWSLLAAEQVDVVLLDLNFGRGMTTGVQGLDWLKALLAQDPQAVVVVVTGHSGIGIAVAAMRAGAADFVMKPWRNDRLVKTLCEAVALRRRRQHKTFNVFAQDAPIIADSPQMRRVLEVTIQVAPTDASVLLLGEAGTGKTLLAHHLHRLSRRGSQALVTLDPATACSAGETSLDAALSGLEPDTTLLLDEVSGLTPGVQLRLATLLPPELRLLTSTRLPREALQRSIQADLLYRLNTVELELPPLRLRGEDVRLLAEHYLRLFGRRHGRPELTFSTAALDAVAAHAWPGNVRELRLAVERATVLAPMVLQGDRLEAVDIPLPASLGDDVVTPTPGTGDLNLARSERAVVEAALRRHGFNVSYAARELGVTRATLYRRMARHGL